MDFASGCWLFPGGWYDESAGPEGGPEGSDPPLADPEPLEYQTAVSSGLRRYRTIGAVGETGQHPH